MSKRHLFLIDPLESLNLALDSSLRMMHALASLGHDVQICEPRQVSWSSRDDGPGAMCRRIAFGQSAIEVAAAAPARVTLREFDALHMRKDPPYDLDYIATTWLLDGAKPRARIYNDPEALRSLNEKLSIFLFPEDTRPALVSSDADELLAFAEQVGGDVVVKPLELFGGRGVFRLTLGAAGTRDKARTTLLEATGGKQPRLVQPFDKAVFDGEVRVFTAFGEAIAWCLKKPAAGNFLANTRAGATLLPYKPSAAEQQRVTRVAQALLARGVALVGFDLIGGYVSELNITSPRMLVGPGADEAAPYARIAQLMAADLGVAPK